MLPINHSSRTIRVAFVGQLEFFAAAALEGPVAGIKPELVDYRMGEDFGEARAALDDLDPDVAVVFRPEVVPAGALEGLRAATVGYLTEPLPRARRPAHRDLRRRRTLLAGLDVDAFDRLVSFDPLIVPAIERVAPVWRSQPLPVADRFFAPPREVRGRPQSIFIGRSTSHRERFLTPVKHRFDTLHIAHGASGERLEALLEEFPIAINLHNEPYPTFENRLSMHLAAGALCISEPVSPTHGLEPGLDFVEIRSPAELAEVMFAATHYFDSYHRIRIRGREKAEAFRASTVWPRLILDLASDLRAFGRRPGAAEIPLGAR